MHSIEQQTSHYCDKSQHLISRHIAAHHALGGCIVEGVPDLYRRSRCQHYGASGPWKIRIFIAVEPQPYSKHIIKVTCEYHCQ